ncbi:MAG: hypothetical protein ACI9KE_000666 [Polyangiales bacterium]|jgi:hypothetical protein
MNPITKRLAQMATIYAAKKVWDRVDSDALQSLARDLYQSTPRQWQENASRLARSSANELQGNATARFDDLIHQAGLIRLANVPSKRGPVLLALAGGALVGAAGTVLFLRSEAGKSFIKKMNTKVDDKVDDEQPLTSSDENATIDASAGVDDRSESTSESNQSTNTSNGSTGTSVS